MKPNVTPQQQAQYNATMLAASGILYGEHGSGVVLDKLIAGKNDLPQTIGHTAAMVLSAVHGGVEQQGKTIPAGILFHADQEIVQDLVEIATTAGLMPKEKSSEVANAAFLQSAKIFNERNLQTPQVPPTQDAAAPQPTVEAAPQPAAPPQGIVGGAMGGQ